MGWKGSSWRGDSPTTPEVQKKAGKYLGLQHIGYPIPVLFITETAEAAEKLATLQHPYLLAATLEAVREVPRGHAVI